MKNRSRNAITDALALQNTNNNLLMTLVQQGSRNFEQKNQENDIRQVIIQNLELKKQNEKIIELLNENINKTQVNHLELKRLLNNPVNNPI